MRALLLAAGALALPAAAQAPPDLPSEVSGAPPAAVRAERAIDGQTESANNAARGETPTRAETSTAVAEAENRRSVASCVSGSGRSADVCRQQRANREVPMSRPEARRIEQRYRTQPRGSTRNRLPSTRGIGAGRR